MLFEPCGDLLKDYGAFCETLRVTEREDVYSAIHARAVELPSVAAGGDGTQAGGQGQAEAEDGRDGAAASQSKAPRKGSPPASKEKASGRRKSSLKSAVEAAGAGGVGETAAAAAAVAALAPPRRITLTSIVLHYPVFCLNQRDMTPLCRAIPHCPSLLSIELVGCGLSVQGYVKLVEAVYRSPRVLSVAVDFNVPLTEHSRHRRLSTAGREAVEPGFVSDPTLHPSGGTAAANGQELLASALIPAARRASAPRASISSALSQDRCFDSSATTAPHRASVTALTPTANPPVSAETAEGVAPLSSDDSTAAQHKGGASNADAAGGGGGRAPVENPAEPPTTAAAASREEEEEASSSVVYLYPTQYCGLDQLPTPLELQLQDDKEKKGKADGKKAQQLQAQRELLRAFDQQHRVAVPKAWEGMLFTGIHSLSLRGNHIGDATVARLAQLLVENTQTRLTSLSLWGNAITDVGAAALARMLRTNCVLKVLDLGNNLLSDGGLLELVQAFLMQQVTTLEEVAAARRAYLTRRGASEEEQRAAAQPLALAEVPCYEDLYAHWWHTQQQQFLQQQLDSGLPATPVGAGRSFTDAAAASATTMLQTPLHYPPPPVRDAQPSPTLAGNAKRSPAAKPKTAKSESVSTGSQGSTSAAAAAAAAAAASANYSVSAARAANRPTVSFDRSCVRVRHPADGDAAIRIPGNAVLEVLNLEDNRHVTLAGVREAGRLLRLREPADTAAMLAMVEVREQPQSQQQGGLTSGASTPLPSAAASPDSSSRKSPAVSQRSPAAAAASSTSSTTPISAAAAAAAASSNVSSSMLPTVGATVIHAPELHCAGLRLRSCGVRCRRESNRATWAEMYAAQAVIDAALAVWSSAAE